MDNQVVEITSEHGEIKHWRKLSARMADFRRDYPPSEYPVTVTAEETLAYRPNLVRLYELALQQGIDLKESGLPGLGNAAVSMVFTATLTDCHGNVLESASAMTMVRGDDKYWEAGESAARQRLIAALGYHGEVLDADEQSQIEQLGGRVEGVEPVSTGAATEPAPPEAESASDDANGADAQPGGEPSGESADEGQDEPPVEGSPLTDSDPEAAGSGDSGESVPEDPGHDGEASSDSEAPSQDAAPSSEVPEAIVRQIETQARLKGVEIPEYRNKKEAKQVLRQLMESKPEAETA